jgi:hypothetical protein
MAALKCLLRLAEGGASPGDYVRVPVSSDPNRRERVRVHLPAATNSASLLRA